MKKVLIKNISFFIIYTYAYAFYIDKVHGKLQKWIEVPTDLFGFIILILLLVSVIKPIIDKLIP